MSSPTFEEALRPTDSANEGQTQQKSSDDSFERAVLHLHAAASPPQSEFEALLVPGGQFVNPERQRNRQTEARATQRQLTRFASPLPDPLQHPSTTLAPIPIPSNLPEPEGLADQHPQPIWVESFDWDDGVEDEVDVVTEYSRLLFDAHQAHVVRLDQKTWVVEGCKDGLPETGSFFHLVLLEGISSVQTTCDCVHGRQHRPCIHKDVLIQSLTQFKGLPAISQYADPMAIEIAEDLHGRYSWVSVLASQNLSGAQLLHHDQKRAIVSLIGPDKWMCNVRACPGKARPASACVHRGRARAYVEEVLCKDLTSMEEGEELEIETIQRTGASITAHHQQQACSTQPRFPPRFCIFPEEEKEATQSQKYCLDNLPEVLKFERDGRCTCGRIYDVNLPVSTRSCLVFHSRGVMHRQIECQVCDCQRKGEQRTIGPDLRAYDLFNWSSDYVFSHELLNAYTSQLAASPTTLSAFHTTVNDAYKEHSCLEPFVARSTFIKVYFSFIQLQRTETAFACPLCGPNPSEVIADGVVLAHSTKFKHVNLQPPTFPGPQINTIASPNKILPLLPSSAARVAMRSFARALYPPVNYHRSLLKVSLLNVLSTENQKVTQPQSQSDISWLQALQGFLCSATDDALLRNVEYALLLRSLLSEVAAEEGVLQFCRPLCIGWLRSIANPNNQIPSTHCHRLAITLAQHSPSIGLFTVMLNNLCASSSLPFAEVVDPLRVLMGQLCAMVTQQMVMFGMRADVFLADCQNTTFPQSDVPRILSPSVPDTQAPSPPISVSGLPFTQTGSLYGSPVCRSRPLYSRFKETRASPSSNDQESNNFASTETGPCRKFFSDYVSQRQTGGIMALWCRHLVCVGFHIIPKCEGRNDVFSAVFTHWPSPPSVIIYDFACQLAPYCLAREPEFFQNVLFVVDQMHQHGHSTCTTSSFLSTYMSSNPDLHHINSSAAECGNSGLSRIKKSVSYCTQEHAMLLIKQFLSVWNRRRTLHLASQL